MATITKRLLSGSTNGKAIIIASTTAASGTLLHTGATGTSTIDEVWVYGINLTTGNKSLTLNWGATASGDKVAVTLPGNKTGMILVVPGFPIQNALIVRGYATGANVIAVHGYVHRIQ